MNSEHEYENPYNSKINERKIKNYVDSTIKSRSYKNKKLIKQTNLIERRRRQQIKSERKN